MQSENVINSLNKSLTSESDNSIVNDFIERIRTYIDGQRWIKKPIVLSPAVCSQFGWKCIKSDLLECVTCGAKLSTHEPKIENYEAYKACVGKILSSLKDNHGKHCPWPLTPTPENFVRMILMPKEEALSQFLKRMKACLSFKSCFPKIKESISLELGFTEHQINALCKMADIKDEEASHIGHSIVLLAATGWTIEEESETGKSALKCYSCQRSVWCGSFSLLEASDKENESKTENTEPDTQNEAQSNVEDTVVKGSSEEPPCKKKRISFVIKKGEAFDSLHEHRPWCLWICHGIDEYSSVPKHAKSVNEKIITSTPGWKIFIKSLLKNISDSKDLEVGNSPSKDQIRNVKNLLEKWTDAM